jgi:DNA-binding MarR family transcriptional regulator
VKETNNRQFYFYECDVLWQLFYRTTRLVGKVRERELKKLDIRADAAVVLFTLIRQGRTATAASVARELFLEPHSVSEQFTRMQKKGLIRRVKDPENKRHVLLEITQKGYDVYFKSAEQLSTRSVLSALSKFEQKELWAILVKMREKALKLSEMETKNGIYPPLDPSQLNTDLINISKTAEAYREIMTNN